MTKFTIPITLSILTCFLPTEKNWGQCQYEQVTHFSGTQSVGCVDVTVTAEGNVGGYIECGFSPYLIGDSGTGSYTFEFSQPITEAKISLTAVDHYTNGLGINQEIVSFEIDGTSYPLTNPGTYPTGCHDNSLFINSDGDIEATLESVGSWEDVIISENMTSLKISDIWLSGLPLGVVFRIEICCIPIICTSNAGMITSVPIELCENQLASIAPPAQTFLDSDDLLEYILFSNLADTLGSIISTSLIPEFSFDPSTMQTGVTYYIAAIVGNNLGGSVDLSDPCLDISNGVEVIWYPFPTVSFSVLNPDVCVNDCVDIAVTLTGSPPFQLTAEADSGGGVVLTINEMISGNTAILPLCVPSGTSIGDLTLTATELVDSFCTCN